MHSSKRCGKCLKELSTEQFYHGSRGYFSSCKSCCAIRHKAERLTNPRRPQQATMRWKKTNAEWLKLRRTLLRYNLTLDQYYAMEDSQDFVCAICGEENAFHVDHNHTTNKVRGLLCPWCNNGLGNYKDDPRKLRSAAQYLEER